MAGGVTRAAVTGIAWGVGTGAALVLAGTLTGGVRPIVKGLIRGGVALSERVQVLAAEGAEMAGDLYHEVLEERLAEREAGDAVRDARDPAVVIFPEGQA